MECHCELSFCFRTEGNRVRELAADGLSLSRNGCVLILWSNASVKHEMRRQFLYLNRVLIITFYLRIND